jgi:hypothetical protein
MSQPPAFSRAFSFTNFQAANPSLVLPGTQVDLELNNAKRTLDAVLANLSLVQRDDGGVANASIGLDQLKAEVPVGFNAPSVWATGTAYTAGSSTVFNGSGFYRCLVTHTSGVFATDLAALKWQLIVNLAAVPLVAANQIAVTPSGSLTTDVQGSLQALDAGKAPLVHTQLSSTISDSTAAGRALLTAADATTQNTLLGTTSLGFQSGDIKKTAVLVLQSGWYYCDGSNKNRVTDVNLFNAITIQQTGITNSTAVVTGLSDTTNGGNTPMSPGMPVSGTGIPAGTVILSVDSGTQVTLSANATGSATTPLVFAPYGVGDGSTTFGLPNGAYIGVGRDNASGSASNITQVSTTIGLTSGSPTSTVASATGLFVGMYVSHPKVPSGTKINAISGTTLTLSNNASGTVSTSAVRFSPILDAQTLGAVGGAISQSTTLVTANLPAYTPTGTITNGTISAGNVNFSSIVNGGQNSIATSSTGTAGGNLTSALNLSQGTSLFAGDAQGGSSKPILSPTVSPTIVMNYIIKR